MDRCSRCKRRLTGIFSTQIGLGPVCLKKSHREQAAAELELARKAQHDLFPVEAAAATLTTRVQSLLARINALEARNPQS